LKLLQENIEKILKNIGIGNNFLDKTLITQEIRARIGKWGPGDMVQDVEHLQA
jgi:hypothetical protein